MSQAKRVGGAAAGSGEMNNRPHDAAAHVSGSIEGKSDDELAKQVVGNSLVAGIIFGYALALSPKGSYGYPDMDQKDLRNFRLVSNCWKKAVSTYLKTKKKPLYVVKMTQENSLTEAPEVQKNGKILDRFVDFLNSREDPDSYAGFCLMMERRAFRLENYDHLLNCLGQCAQHLVEMQLDIPKNGGSFPGQLPNTLQLPALQTLRLNELTDSCNFARLTEAAEKLPNPSANLITMIQSILQNCNNTLKHFHIPCSMWVPPELQYVSLPSTLVTLELCNSEENPRMLECLTRNSLPELKELTLHYWYDQHFPGEDLFFRVLENLRQSLRVLKILKQFDPRGREFKLRFPLMESLKRLELMGNHFKLSSEMASLSSLFPRLTHVVLDKVGGKLANQFSSPISSVTSLEFDIKDDEYDNEEDYFWSRLALELMKGIYRAFPNLTDLTFDHYGTDFQYLQYMFREMGQLKRLSIGIGFYENITTDHWDSLLMGAPLKFVKELRKGNFWKDIDLNIKTGYSIKMLKELTYLKLSGVGRSARLRGPLISDLAFIYAFNGMPKLEHVKLQGEFLVSKKIVAEWEKQGRRIEYNPSSKD